MAVFRYFSALFAAAAASADAEEDEDEDDGAAGIGTAMGGIMDIADAETSRFSFFALLDEEGIFELVIVSFAAALLDECFVSMYIAWEAELSNTIAVSSALLEDNKAPAPPDFTTTLLL